jgi:hypothetical protein
VHQDDLGRLETGIFSETHLGAGQDGLAAGWGGDRFALVELPGGGLGLAWAVVWDDTASRDAWLAALSGHLERLPPPATLEAVEVGGRPGSLLRVGLPAGVGVLVGIRP